MIIFWQVRYLDRQTKEFNDRDLVLDTDTLAPATKAAVELLMETRSKSSEKEVLKFRNHFVEGDLEHLYEKAKANGITSFAAPIDYFEDEIGNQISADETGRVLTGNPNARSIPFGAKQHDIDLMFSEPKPIPIAEITLSQDDLKTLGYFVRDFKELTESAFLKDGPGTIGASGGSDLILETAVSDDEIRSFVTIFRRLYMKTEAANFLKAVEVYARVLGDHPFAKWVRGVGLEYEDGLESVVEFPLITKQGQNTFKSKRLIDVFLYTQYAHQPSRERQRQYKECLKEVHGNQGLLTFLFLTELWKHSLTICNSGRIIAAWFNRYCQHHQVAADVLASVRDENPGIGSKEKEEHRKERIFREKVESLATEIWIQKGRPEGGTQQFFLDAEEELRKALEL